jgi:ABC-type transport system involved in multi-copper enzyme maturation permease subunit
VLFFAVFIVGVSALFGSVTIGDQLKVVADFGLFSLSFFGAVATIVCGVTLLNKELKQKTIYNVISKPVHRSEFIVGKWLGISLAVSLMVCLMGLGLLSFLWLLGSTSVAALPAGILLAMMEVCVVAAVSVFFSSLVVTVTLSGLFTFATYLAGHSINYLSYFLSGEGEVGETAKLVVQALDKILPNLNLFNMSERIVYGEQVPTEHLLLGVTYSASYSVILLMLACLIFSRRELN